MEGLKYVDAMVEVNLDSALITLASFIYYYQVTYLASNIGCVLFQRLFSKYLWHILDLHNYSHMHELTDP